MSNSTEVVASAAIAPDLSVVDGQITTISTQVAAHFNKRHADVLRAIRNLDSDVDADFYQRNFASVMIEFTNGKGGAQKAPAFRITRDGFTLLAMGFTGKEAMQWKVAYLTAFNKMEAELLARTARTANPSIDYERISPAQAQDLKELVHAVAESKVQGYAETWARLHRKFRVNSYLELPASRFEEARGYLLGKLPERQEDNLDPADAKAMAAARKVALDYFDDYRAAVKDGKDWAAMADIPQDVLHGMVASALMNQRMLVSFDCRTGQMCSTFIPVDASVVSFTKDDYYEVAQRIPMDRIPEMLEAVSKRVGLHLGAFRERLQRDREHFKQVRHGVMKAVAA